MSTFQLKREALKPNEIRKFALKNFYFYIDYNIIRLCGAFVLIKTKNKN